MIPLEYELDRLKEILIELIDLVRLQIKMAGNALIYDDKKVAENVIRNELRVNALEINIDRECEYLLACYNPLAKDLRFVIASIKISTALERIGDYAYRIARIIDKGGLKKDDTLYEKLEIKVIIEKILDSFEMIIKSLEEEKEDYAQEIFVNDNYIDEIKRKSTEILKSYIANNMNAIEDSLNLYVIINKLERAGDQLKNIAEEVIFYLNARIIKHYKREKKIKKFFGEEDNENKK